MWIRTAMCVLLLAGLPIMGAAKDTTVEGIQASAWLTRDGNRTPLKRGTTLKEKDQLETGQGARLLLRLPEGSSVKLGENAKLEIQSLQFNQTGKGLLSGALAVVRGAFRFTTGTLRKFKGERDLKISLTTATAGIRGTDIWGKSLADREVFMLIEGNVSITRANEPPVEMNEPLTVYSAPKDKPAAALAPAEVDQITQWAAETEMGGAPEKKTGKKGKKAAQQSAPEETAAPPVDKPSKKKKEAAGRNDGKFFVAVAEYASQDGALELYDRLRAAGMQAAIRPLTTETGTTYRVRVIGFDSSASAEAAVAQIKGLVPDSQPRVSR